MQTEKIIINQIPSKIWGKPADKAYIYVHGKSASKEVAQSFAKIAEQKGYQTLSFDLAEHGERIHSDKKCDIFNGIQDLDAIQTFAFSQWKEVALYACSIGAYFSLNAYADSKFSKCLFQSPILDMEYLIHQMFAWFHISEQMLLEQREIATPMEALRWDYYQFACQHPIAKWNIPTAILYAAKDNLQPIDIVKSFTEKYGCALTVSEDSEHPFMALSDREIVANWLKKYI